MKNIYLFVSFIVLIIVSGCLENTVSTDLNYSGMTHDTLSVSSVSGFNYQTPPELGNSTVLYLGTDLKYKVIALIHLKRFPLF